MAMPRQQLLLEVSKLTELQSVRMCMKESLKGALVAGVSTLFGGMLLGPAGLAIGGAIGGCSAAVMAKNNFKSIPHIIRHELTPQQQDDLVAAILEAIRSIPVRDAIDFAANIAQDPAVATTVAMTVVSYLNSQPGMEIID